MKLKDLLETYYTLKKAEVDLPKDKVIVPRQIGEMLIKNTKLRKYLGIKTINND